MKTVYKYKLETVTAQVIELPKGAEVLSVKNQHEEICLYAKVDTEEKELQIITVLIFGTGHNIPPGANEAKYVDTVSLQGGMLMFHVFYINDI